MEKNDTDGEKTTARFLGEVFNSLMKGIVFTTETVGDFPEEFGLPTLDTCWRMTDDEGWGRRIQYRFFRKPLSSKWVTPYNSAQPINSKIATQSQDTFRILNNCSKDVTKEE